VVDINQLGDLRSPYKEYGHLLNALEKNELDELLGQFEQWPISLNQLWRTMDHVWEQLQCSNKKPDQLALKHFYEHPVWLLNGLFSEADEDSINVRRAVASFIINEKSHRILDYGGGFCTLSRLIAREDPSVSVDIVEPHSFNVSRALISTYGNIQLLNKAECGYDCVVLMDVLEHLFNPIEVLHDVIQRVKVGGIIVLGNCFFPVIKCHIPSTFHLRYTIDNFVQLFGGHRFGRIENTHAIVYRRLEAQVVDWSSVRKAEVRSRMLFLYHEGRKRFRRKRDKFASDMVNLLQYFGWR